MFRKVLVVLYQMFLLWLINQTGYLLVGTFNIPLPGNVVGMVILFTLLATKIIPLSFIELGASILVRHLGFFFIPISVGLISYGSLFMKYGFVLLGIILASLLFGIYVSGVISQIAVERMKKSGDNSRNHA